MTSNDNEDPTVPSGKFPEGPGPDDRTMPAGDASKKAKPPADVDADGLDHTVPAGKVPVDSASEDATLPSGVVDGASEDPTVSSDRAAKDAKDAKGGKSSPEPAKSKKAFSPGELMGQTIGGCRVDKLLGRGAMGAVYKARQLKLDRDVAVKVIRPEMMTDPRMLKRFEIEARTVGKFNSANVVMVHDVGFELGVHYIVMEFVEGKDLRQHVKLLAGGRLPAGEALPLIRQACKGLEEARRLKVVHRDIKPDNLMLTTQNVLKIADFGIAKPEEDFSMTLTSELIGTPLYMSPEQCQGGGNIDYRSDMYSLGATFFYLLTGEPPIRASSVYELIQTKTKLENLCLWKSLPELDENHPLSRVIERMTANDREDRYESYEELLNDLLLVEAGETITVRAKRIKKDTDEREGRRTAEQKSGSGALMVVLLLLVLGGGGGGYWWWSNQPKEKIEDVNVGGGGQGNGEGNDPGNDQGNTGNQDGPGDAASNSGGAFKRAQAALAGLGEQFLNSGASEDLSTAIANLEVPESLVQERDQLKSDVDDLVGIEAALASLQLPAPSLPFDGIAPFFATLKSKATVPADSRPALQKWATRREADTRSECERVLGGAAVVALVAAREELAGELEAFRGDRQGLAGLQEKMSALRSSRQKLNSLIPGQQEALDREVRVDTLDELELALIRAGFLSSGETAALLDQIAKVNPTAATLIAERTDLFTAMTDYSVLGSPGVIEAPDFEAVVRFRTGMAKALEKVDGGRSLDDWLVEEKAKLYREADMLAAAGSACRVLFDSITKRLEGEDLDGLEGDLSELKLAIANAKRLFGPDAVADLDVAVPPDELRQAVAGLQARVGAAAGDRIRTQWRKDLKEYTGQLRDLTLATWSAEEFQVKEDALREALNGIVDPEERAKLEPGLQQFSVACDAWARSKSKFDSAAAKLASGALMQCIDDLKDTSSVARAKRELGVLSGLARECASAFELVEQELDLDAAEAKLDAAMESARGLSLFDVTARIKVWSDGLLNLKNAAAGMKPIAAGNSQKRDVGFVKRAFFMSATECSVDEFRKFMSQANAVDFAVAAAKLPSFAGKDRMLRSIFNKRLPVADGRKPVSAKWFEAAAYCEWKSLQLPTHDEWALAAFGDGGKREFPWGSDKMSKDMDDYNCSQAAVDVDDRGNQTGGMHHLAGNVAEWLHVAGDAFKAPCVGGGFKDSPRSAEKYARGELHMVDREMGRLDVGFRTVLRPGSFPGFSWPKDWASK